MSALAAFILSDMEDILSEWQAFASTVLSAKGMDRKGLRDDAEWILRTIALDMQTWQSKIDQEAKSKDTRARRKDAAETAAEAHSAQRFLSGFDLNEMVSEYRALRASVIRLWTASCNRNEVQLVEELTRFDEGIDKALSESIRYFAGQLDRSRELFMGILGHDLRNPLHVIQSSAARLLRTPADLEEHQRLGTYIRDGADQIALMLSDLLDTVRTQLGGSLPLSPEELDLGAMCKVVARQFQLLHPMRELRCNIIGEVRGRWDPIRLQQLVANLLRNAFQHGAADTMVVMNVALDHQSAVISVHNDGEPIPAELMVNIFEPLRRSDVRGAVDNFSMGLGLYIASTIAKAHEGTITVESTRDQGTTFTTTLPLAA
jgi:signal transduction histidine kinase